jgi:hypothetical protein
MTAQHRYRIRVQGRLGQRWAGWLEGLEIAHEWTGDGAPTTTLTGAVADQVALRSLLCRIWDLNLVLVSVERISLDPEQEGARCDG